jgi:hypothetical protein
MTKTAFIAISLGALLYAGGAGAVTPTATRTWVSGAGNDMNACTRTAPCATFAQAYSVTSAGGEIDVLDGGDFGVIDINHAITIANDGAGVAAITLTGANGAAIAIGAGSTDAVVLRGLTLNGLNGANGGNFGVLFTTGGSLLIDHCTILGFQSAAAVMFEPSNPAMLWVKDTVLVNDGTSASASIWIRNAGGNVGPGPITARLERLQILHAIGNGVRVDATPMTNPIDAELRDVTVDGASGGSGIVAVSATSGGPAVKLVADSVTSSHSAGYGLRAVGATASVALSRSVIEDNGVGIGASSGGVVYSYGDNRFANNTGGDGVAPTPIGLK